MVTQERKSFLFASSAVLLWSTVATAFKLALHGLSFVQLLFFASLTSLIFLLVKGIYSNKKFYLSIIDAKNIKRNLLLGALNPFLYYLVLFKAYSLLPAQEAQPLNYTWPIAISIFTAVFLKHKLNLKTIFGLIIAFAGVIVISTRGQIFQMQFHSLTGVIFAVGSSVIWAAFWTLNLVDKRSIDEKLFNAFLFGVIFTSIYMLLFDSFEVKEPVYLLGAVYVGLFEMGLTFFLWMKGLQLSTNKAATSTLAYFSPFLSIVFIALILKEKILISSVVGLALIIGGVLVQRVGKNPSS